MLAFRSTSKKKRVYDVSILAIDYHDCAGTLTLSEHGQILFTRKTGKKKWQITKGHTEKDEVKFAAATRETEEEAGVSREKLIALKHLGSYKVIRSDFRKRVHMWLCVIEDKQENFMPTDPLYEEARFFDFDAETLPAILRHQEEIEFCLRHQQKIRQYVDGLKAAFRQRLAMDREEPLHIFV